MTKIGPGPSLPQAQESHQHSHNNHHQNRHHGHQHHHNNDPINDHQDSYGYYVDRYQTGVQNPHTLLHEKPLPRAADLESHVTEVIRTVSVVKYIDGSGSVVDVSTVTPSSTSQPTYEAVGLTVDPSILESLVPSIPVSPSLSLLSIPSTSDYAESATSPNIVPPTTGTALPSASGTRNSTFTPSVNATASSLPGSLNSTSIHPLSFANSSSPVSHFPNASAVSTLSLWSSQSSSSSWSSLHSFSSGSSSTRSSTGASSTSEPTSTGSGGNGDAGGPVLTVAAPTSSATGSSSSSGPSTVSTEAVVGGVVGGLAGVALIAMFLMFVLKWKKQQGNAVRLLGSGDASTGWLSLFGRGGPGGGSGQGSAGGGMVERSTPFAIPASFAALTGNRRASQPRSEPAESDERGFYRVSGRKLTSVLLSGGDGYSDPHESTISETSYRNSMATFSGPNSKPLQLGSPMRPESGVMVVRTGPARTPVQEQNPFSDDNRVDWDSSDRLSPPEPLGRSLTSQAGSFASVGSGSRFTENV